MRHWIASTALLCSLGGLVCAEEPANKPAQKPAAKPAAAQVAPEPPKDPRLAPPVEHLDLKDGDTVVFLGDSITHQCLYTQFIEDFYYTRMPGVHVRFHNAGVGGDRASDALARFDMDVAAYKPKYVTILLGMNDGGYKQWDAATFETYQKGMLELLEKIKGIGATAIVMGPTMYDRDALLIKPSPKRPFDGDTSKYYNAVLAFYGTYMRDQANERGLNYVDMFASLNTLSIDERLKDPNFTMIPDAVHPDANGQTVMAAAFLDAVRAPRGVSNTAGRFDGKEWTVKTNGKKATDVSGDADHLTFTATEPCLPWILPADAAIGYKLVVGGHHHSGQPFQISGLAPGKYELLIDGQKVGVFPASLLAVKIELQNFEKCPQYQQALAVAELNKEKNDKAMRPLRNLYGALKGKRRSVKSPEELTAYLAEMKPKVDELEKQNDEYDKKIYELAQPKPHKYELLRATDAK